MYRVEAIDADALIHHVGTFAALSEEDAMAMARAHGEPFPEGALLIAREAEDGALDSLFTNGTHTHRPRAGDITPGMRLYHAGIWEAITEVTLRDERVWTDVEGCCLTSWDPDTLVPVRSEEP